MRKKTSFIFVIQMVSFISLTGCAHFNHLFDWLKPGYESETPKLEPNAYYPRELREPSESEMRRAKRAERSDFADESQDAGSLWASSGQTNYYFTKNKVRSAGDIITLVIDNNLYRDLGFEIKRSLGSREKDIQRTAFESELRAQKMRKEEEMNHNSGNTLSSATPSSPTPGSSPQPSSSPLALQEPITELPLESMMELKPGDTLTGEILERYPNGNYKIKAFRKVPLRYTGEYRYLLVEGLVRSSALPEENEPLAARELYGYKVSAYR